MENIFKPPTILPGKASQRRRMAPIPSEPPEERKVISKGRDYVNEFTQQEESFFRDQLMQSMQIKNEKPEHGNLSTVDSFTNVTSIMDNSLAPDMKENKVFACSLYQNNPKKPKCDENLPILKDREDIIKKIRANKVFIIKGRTGCGKTTQVPQFIFDDAFARKEYCNIVVTQPRRIAAMTVAKRVCEERGCDMGTLVGYQIGLDRKMCENTRILYCTTGVLLEKLIASKTLAPFTHVILDEVHERDQDMDFLLLVAKRLVNTNSRDVKVILMSATFDTTMFAEYFYTVSSAQKIFPPTKVINEKSPFTVRIYYLDEFKNKIHEATGICPVKDVPEINRKGYITAVRLIEAFDNLDKEENRGKDTYTMGSVLIFLPGMHEIEEMHKTLNFMMAEYKEAERWKIYPLHSSITYEEQKAAFRRPAEGERKIILSTNITESSVTVSDMKYVIDFCLTKSLIRDPFMSFCTLRLEWTSKNNLEQRAGRVGRVSDGRVYRLITKDFYQKLDQEPIPEIRRCPLDQLTLKAKLLDMGEPRRILASALDQPDFEHIEQTICQLKLIGALKTTAKDKYTSVDGDLTFLGQVIAKLPMDSRLGKLIFLGYLLNVSEECIVMACAMATKPMFSNPFQQYLQAYNSKLAWADSSCSDCIAFCNAYKLWRKQSMEGLFKRGNREYQWGKDRFVEIRTLREIATLEADVKRRLRYCDMMSNDPDSVEEKRGTFSVAEKALFLKLAIAGAFYPNYFLRGTSGQIDEKEAVNVLNGHSPFTSVYLQGMPTNQPRLLYKKAIEKKFESVSRTANVVFDPCTKVFVDFGETNEGQRRDNFSSTIPGKVDMAVYRAVKMGKQPEFRFNIRVLNPQDAQKRYNELVECQKELQAAKRMDNKSLNEMEWPWNKYITNLNSIYTKSVKIIITHFKSPFQFWAQSSSFTMKEKLNSLYGKMNNEEHVNLLKITTSKLKIGKIYAGRYREDRKWYRCRIVSEGSSLDTYNIFFVDYGNYEKNVSTEDIREFEKEFALTSAVETLPNMAVEFRLAKVKPLESIFGINTKKRENFERLLKECYSNKEFEAKVYSQVKDVVHVKLPLAYELTQRAYDVKHLNDYLIFEKIAEKTNETYLSIMNHTERKKYHDRMKNGHVEEENVEQKLDLNNLDDIDSPAPNECTQEIFLKGPHSPLEMKLFGCTQCTVAKTVKIEQTSVNSILLDTNPSDSHERMLVSAFVGTNESGDRLTLRHSTVMPNLPGLPALVILIFSPMVELRTNSCNTKLSGALCGLGYNSADGTPLYGEQDIELVFDVEITLTHIITINKIRYWLNRASCQTSLGGTAVKEMHTASQKLTKYCNDLFSEKFELQELYYNANSYRWDMIPKEDLLNPFGVEATDIQHPANDTHYVFRLIWGIHLEDSSCEKELQDKVIRNITQLREFTRQKLMTTTGKSFKCILCQVELTNPVSTKLHLKSYQHKVRAKRFDVPDESKSFPNDSRSPNNTMYPQMMPGPSSVNYNMHLSTSMNSVPLNVYPDRSYMQTKPR